MNAASLGLRDPVLIAKACATIDILSEGQLLPVFAVGSALSGVLSNGQATKGRGKRTDEGLQVISRLWTEDRVDFVGDYYQLEKATINPQASSEPNASLGEARICRGNHERTARWGTGWQAGIETAAEIQPGYSANQRALCRARSGNR